ncbi:GDSL-like Lipase/Acylhydrolase superfamily protein [Tasmannia lanceolata]|uniref:GDSL-like Lipase/Acylhydrolase superfamily protein n=1 Tax=Tasmannia lanceolata TaxID=3420 RepID=UPI004064B186
MECYTSFSPLLSILTISLVVAAAAAAASTTHSKYTNHFSKIYAFGDSFTDTGNTGSNSGPNAFIHVSNPPYGNTYFHHPTNRYSDGRLVIDFLTTTLSLPFLPPYLKRASDFSHGVDFAVAGSTALDHEFFVKNNITVDITPQSLQTQLKWFNNYLESKGCGAKRSPKCNLDVNDALFWVGEIGANDYAYSFASNVPSSTVQELAIKNVNAFLQALLEKGAKYVVVQGLPLTGCLPLALYLASPDDRDALGCVASANKQSNTHNRLLQAKIQQLRTQYPNAIISYADYWNAHRTIMQNPAKYGLTETFKTCCGSGGGPYNFDIFATCGSPTASTPCADPSKFVNWDGVHLTEAMYRAVADLLLHRGYSRPSFDVLLRSKIHGG